MWTPFSLYIPVSLNGHTAELLWVPGVFLAVTTAGINLSRKSDVTEHRSRQCIVARRRYLVGRSVWRPVALNISQRCLIDRDVFPTSGGLQHAKITLTSFLGTSWHGFPVTKREKSNLFDVFSRHYDTAKWMRWKLNVQFHSVHRIRRACSFNVLKITTLNNSCAFLSHIIHRLFTNTYISKTFFG